MRIFAIVFACLLAFFASCSSSSNEEPYRECLKDSDCGAGYKCQYNECVRIIDSDGDGASGQCITAKELTCVAPGETIAMCIAGNWSERACVNESSGACVVWKGEIGDSDSDCCPCCDPSWDSFSCQDSAIVTCDIQSNSWVASDCNSACLDKVASALDCCPCCNPATDSYRCEENKVEKCDGIASMWQDSTCQEACADPSQPYLHCCDCVVDGDVDDLDDDQDAVEWEGSQDCLPENLDPNCETFSELFCFSNIRHDVYYCQGSDLRMCDLRCDLTYPNCGWITDDRKVEVCQVSCVQPDSNEEDAWCEVLEDGDEELDNTEIEEEMQMSHEDGMPCTPGVCIPGSYCQLDWDEEGRYCAPAYDTCVFHVGMEPDEKADFYDSTDKMICVGDTHKRCIEGDWIGETTCAEAETCTSGIGCQ